MLFNSYIYLLIFLPLSLLGFALFAKVNLRAGFIWLVMTSLVFYGWWNPDPTHSWTPFYIILILLSCAGNYLLGRAIAAKTGKRQGKVILIAGITANLLLLGYYKYSGFIAGIFLHLTGCSANVPQIVLPLAISFFTFLQIAYLVDAFRGKVDENHHFTDYLLFVTFFPHLIAGPLVHHKEMIPQFTKRREKVLRYRDLSIGLTILIIGLFKKVVVADPLSAIATPLFDASAAGRPLGMAEGWVAILSYTLQLYFDFSGYSDMAIGSARLFGIRFPLNFHSPYKATSIVDFWRRWHMTLSRFLRDYLYFPLGGNRKGSARRYVNLMLTMIIGGLWHGAGWTFLAWGFIHGALLCCNHAWFSLRDRWRLRPLPRVPAIGLTFLAVALAWVFFRAPTFGAAVSILKSAFGLGSSIGWPEDGRQIVEASDAFLPLAGGLIIAWCFPNTQQFLSRYRPALGLRDFEAEAGGRKWWQWRPDARFAILTLLLAYLTAREFDKISEFIYFQF